MIDLPSFKPASKEDDPNLPVLGERFKGKQREEHK